MSFPSIERNRAHLGRLFAGLLAVILITIIPLRSLARSAVKTQDSYIESCLNGFVNTVAAAECFTVSDYELFLERLSASGVILDCELIVTRHLKAVENDDIYDVRYNGEVLDKLYSEGKYSLDGQDMLTVRLVERKESAAMKVCNMLSSDTEVRKEYISGWKAEG